MPYRINKSCVKCDICVDNCPSRAISEGYNRQYVIDREKCVECGYCFTYCPIGAVEEYND